VFLGDNVFKNGCFTAWFLTFLGGKIRSVAKNEMRLLVFLPNKQNP
jgi:hypothetical protein